MKSHATHTTSATTTQHAVSIYHKGDSDTHKSLQLSAGMYMSRGNEQLRRLIDTVYNKHQETIVELYLVHAARGYHGIPQTITTQPSKLLKPIIRLCLTFLGMVQC